MAGPLRQRGILILKGVAMGAADVVPGVSGGTIAFITGIYEELLASLRSFNATAVRTLFREGIGAFWRHVNGSFLLPLLFGIGVSIVTLAKAITYLLDRHPVLLWAFFFGLILASVFLVGKAVQRWSGTVYLGLLAGSLVSYYITTIETVADGTTNLGYVLLCGMVAICAMILPGISGSFILVLMGAYGLILGTINSLRDAAMDVDLAAMAPGLKIIGTFAVGAVVGLLAFSHTLTWLFRRWHDLTMAILIGFLVGSLNKIWPWKETLSTKVRHAGRPDEAVVPLIQSNVAPWNYAELNRVETEQLGWTGREAHLGWALALAVAGFALILVLERLGPDPDPSAGDDAAGDAADQAGDEAVVAEG